MNIPAELNLGLSWNNRFTQLGKSFYTHLRPTPLPNVHWVSCNHALAREMGFEPDFFDSPQLLDALSGNGVIKGSSPLASVYSGHQFGHWAGQLGDGRALYLGEIQTTNGSIELQLKGAGKTPYSRSGDGRAVLRSSIREYLCSEAMHALSIPTTRALSITGSKGIVYREEVETAAVVARVSPSFIRFGHFEHFSANGETENLKQLADFVINEYSDVLTRQNEIALTHENDIAKEVENNKYARLLLQVVIKTAKLIANWQSVGFCHGVMNTDNMSILGLTIDYGPFQFMDNFDVNHICNHSDHSGRYAYGQQPNIGLWNLYCLGQSLLPLIADKDLTVKCLEFYKEAFSESMLQLSLKKLGFNENIDHPDISSLVPKINSIIQMQGADFTVFWRTLSHCVSHSTGPHDLLAFDKISEMLKHENARSLWLDFLPTYLNLLSKSDQTHEQIGLNMLKINPKFVLRNHLGETAIKKAQAGDFSEVDILLKILTTPYDEHEAYDDYANPPPDWAKSISISCSS